MRELLVPGLQVNRNFSEATQAIRADFNSEIRSNAPFLATSPPDTYFGHAEFHAPLPAEQMVAPVLMRVSELGEATRFVLAREDEAVFGVFNGQTWQRAYDPSPEVVFQRSEDAWHIIDSGNVVNPDQAVLFFRALGLQLCKNLIDNQNRPPKDWVKPD